MEQCSFCPIGRGKFPEKPRRKGAKDYIGIISRDQSGQVGIVNPQYSQIVANLGINLPTTHDVYDPDVEAIRYSVSYLRSNNKSFPGYRLFVRWLPYSYPDIIMTVKLAYDMARLVYAYEKGTENPNSLIYWKDTFPYECEAIVANELRLLGVEVRNQRVIYLGREFDGCVLRAAWGWNGDELCTCLPSESFEQKAVTVSHYTD